jgi:hypothetical protein
MEKTDTVIAVFADHNSAEAAVKKLSAADFISVLSARDIKLTKRSSASTTRATGSSFGARGMRSGAISGACSLAGCS